MEHIKAPQFGSKSVIRRVHQDTRRIHRLNQFIYHVLVVMCAITISIVTYKIRQACLNP